MKMARVVSQNNTFGADTPSKGVRKMFDKMNYEMPSTVVMENIPAYDYWREALSNLEFKQLTIKLGISITNPVDQFNRKIGLKLASERMVDLQVVPTAITVNSNQDIEVSFNYAGTQRHVFSVQFGPRGRAMFTSKMWSPAMYKLLYEGNNEQGAL